MNKKTYTLFVDGEDAVDYGTKKTAVKYGDESGKTYQVHSPSGAVVHAVQKTVTPKPGVTKDPAPTVEQVALKHSISRTLPGNYSIVTAPMVRELAEALGLVAHEVRFAGKLERRVEISSNNKTSLTQAGKIIDQTLEEAHAALRQWQKDNLEKRRGLTDMQKYLQHRKVLADFGHAAAQQLREIMGEVSA